VRWEKGRTIDEQEVIDFCKNNLAGYKKPTAVAVVPATPRNPSGKALKRLLREEDQHEPSKKKAG